MRRGRGPCRPGGLRARLAIRDLNRLPLRKVISLARDGGCAGGGGDQFSANGSGPARGTSQRCGAARRPCSRGSSGSEDPDASIAQVRGSPTLPPSRWIRVVGCWSVVSVLCSDGRASSCRPGHLGSLSRRAAGRDGVSPPALARAHSEGVFVASPAISRHRAGNGRGAASPVPSAERPISHHRLPACSGRSTLSGSAG